MNHVRSALVLLGLCLALSGCFRVEQQVKVSDNGSLELNQIFAADLSSLDAEALGLPQGALDGDQADEFCRGIREGSAAAHGQLHGGVVRDVSNYSDGDYCGVQFKSKWESSTDHSVALTQILEQSTRLVETAQGWEFETTVAPEKWAAEAGATGAQMMQAFEQGDITLVVELPGQALDGQHNASKVSGGKFTWNIDPLDSPDRLMAVTGPKTGLNALPVSPKVLAVIGVNLAVLAGLAWFFVRPEKQAPVAVQDTPAGAGSAMASTAAVAAAASPGTPYFDKTYGIWMLDDPVQGMLWHREATDEWVPFT